MVGCKKQIFWPKINILKGNHCILRLQGAPVHQKLGMILENQVVEVEVRKNVFYKKWSPKLISLNDFFFNSVDFQHTTIDFERPILTHFDKGLFQKKNPLSISILGH